MRIGSSQRAGTQVREPAVAGRFYPGRAQVLAADIDGYLGDAREALAARPGAGARGQDVVGIVVPHAGYMYSGPTAGFGFAQVPASTRRIVLLGPAHFLPVAGMGLSSARAWRTPLGDVEIDAPGSAGLAADFPAVGWADDALAPEHSLEVQVPFLQRVLDPGWTLLPIIVGRASTAEVAAVLERCAGQPGTVLVISTDLSHYLPYEQARRVDAHTLAAIAARNPAEIADSDACGSYGLRGLLRAAAHQGWTLSQLDARNSGDTAGDRQRVVGYCAFACTREGLPTPDEQVSTQRSQVVPEGARHALLGLARATIMAALAGAPSPDWRPVAQQWPVCAADGAAFVTLRTAAGDLLGCIGSLEPRMELARDVAQHAYDAAFRDTRFPAMTSQRARDMVIDISVLGPTRPFPAASYADLVATLEPGTGLVVSAGRHRGTFLPAVWETLPTPAEFVSALWRKAGLYPGDWPRGIALSAYGVEEFSES